MTEQAEKKVVEQYTADMTDGRKVVFTGKKKLIKTVDEASNTVRFDFRNGETRTYLPSEQMVARLALHGAAQKIGDETASVDDIDDMVVAVDEMIARLDRGEWGVTRAAGDGFSGASVVIRAICEASGKSVAEVKDFLQKKLDSAKAANQPLTRQALYASFRTSAAVGPIIERMESEKAKKAAVVNADALMSELG